MTGESFLQGDVDAVIREVVMNSVKGSVSDRASVLFFLHEDSNAAGQRTKGALLLLHVSSIV